MGLCKYSSELAIVKTPTRTSLGEVLLKIER